jgi:DNA-binding response OmpR family regulator
MIRKVLLVDDDPILRIALEKRLASFSDSFTVITASDGFEAVQQLKNVSFSLIILDLIMPRMDGMSLMAHIREKYADLPVIVISSMRTPEMQKMVKSNAVLAYLRKPFQAEALVSVIMNSLRKEADGGIMHGVSPTVFLQLMEMEGKTCTIRIFDKVSEAGGVLYFIEGRLVDARVGDRHGIDAAYKVCTWEVVTLFMQNACEPRENIINSELQPIIMKAVGMKDESDNPDDESEDIWEEESEPISAAGKMPASPLHDIGTLLLAEGCADFNLEELSFDETMGKIVDQLNELGAGSGFGDFQVASVATKKKHDLIILPGQPAPVISISPGSAQERILEILRNNDKIQFNRRQ